MTRKHTPKDCKGYDVVIETCLPVNEMLVTFAEVLTKDEMTIATQAVLELLLTYKFTRIGFHAVDKHAGKGVIK